MGGSARQGRTEKGLGVCRVRVKVPYARERDRETERERGIERVTCTQPGFSFLFIYLHIL